MCLVGIYFQIFNYFQVSCAHANNCLMLFLCPSKQSHTHSKSHHHILQTSTVLVQSYTHSHARAHTLSHTTGAVPVQYYFVPFEPARVLSLSLSLSLSHTHTRAHSKSHHHRHTPNKYRSGLITHTHTRTHTRTQTHTHTHAHTLTHTTGAVPIQYYFVPFKPVRVFIAVRAGMDVFLVVSIRILQHTHTEYIFLLCHN